MTADEKEKLMKELIKARDKAKGSAAPAKAEKPKAAYSAGAGRALIGPTE